MNYDYDVQIQDANCLQSQIYYYYRARIMSWQFCVNIFWNAMVLAQKVDR